MLRVGKKQEHLNLNTEITIAQGFGLNETGESLKNIFKMISPSADAYKNSKYLHHCLI